MEFINAFMQQFVLFLVFVALAVGAAFIGIALRKNKNKKEEAEKAAQNEDTATES